MKQRNLILLFLLTFLLALPAFALASSKSQVIFSLDVLTDPIYQASSNQWQIANNTDEGLYAQSEGGMLLKSEGDPTIIYPISFGYKDFDKLIISFSTNKLTEVRVIPDITTTALNGPQFKKLVYPTGNVQKIEYSLRHRFFKDVKNDIGINFYTIKPANIIIHEIRLEKLNPIETASQVVVDYFTPAAYLPFTVNLFPAPFIFGRSAMAYFAPLLLVALFLLLRSNKWRKKAVIFLLAIFFLTDFRMAYEFLTYHITDYKTFVKPPVEEKVLRNYADFYSFSNWLGKSLPEDIESINYMSLGSADFPRILHYELYPLIINDDNFPSKFYAIYNRSDIRYSAHDRIIFDSDGPLSAVGELVDIFSENSFTFRED